MYRRSARHEQVLLSLTSLPTASGREQRVVDWIERWARRRDQVELKQDRFGNLMLKRSDARSRRPIVLTAHMDHPAFVVTAVGDHTIGAEFRGGVADRFFQGAAVLVHHGRRKPQAGRIISLQMHDGAGQDKQVVARFDDPVRADPGDIMTWDTGPAAVEDGHLHAPACDDLAGVAAALCALEKLLRVDRDRPPDVRVLLTRAEEIGLVGAVAACRSGLIPKMAHLVVLEASKSFAESPIGGGPIVRVGDRTSTFDPGLTFRVGAVAEAISCADSSFEWQRKLMPGGTCEASAYQSMGYATACVCLPLGNYHNMNEATRQIDAETIALSDYHGLIRLLVEIGQNLDRPGDSLQKRLDERFDQRRHLLEGECRTIGPW